MATGVGTSFDISKLGKELDRLDKQLDTIVKKGEKAQQAIEQMLLGNNAANFLNKIEKIKKNVIDLSSIKDPMKWDSAKLKGYIDQVNRLLRTVNQINEVNGGKNQLVDTAQLEKAKKEFKSLLTEVKSLERAQGERSMSRNQTYSGALKYSANVKNLEQERQAVINLEAARDKLKKSDADYATKLNTLNSAIQKHEQNLRNATKTDQQRAEEARKASEKIIEAQRREREEYEKRKTTTMDRFYSSNSSRALGFSTNAKTLEEEARAVRYLEAARAKLNTQDANYKSNLATLNAEIKRHKRNLDEAKRGSQELKKQHRGLLDTSGQLARAMAAVFSVSAIKGYINKLIEVRGEFELQQRSLQVLLQNKEKADELWNKTVELAVKSPLTTQQLVTSTKQLAAYRIEHEKLYETNKMLADISQGLGVDMNRLILAFGQVKAANFLRGTELRQFSEAGVNLLDELAKRFSEIEGRVVSVGDVFERVSKRMVKFEDVEAVLKTITSEGGIFYQMQEKQSETLRGMVLNLKDSYSLMMNDIGKKSDSTIKRFIKMIRDLINNWRKVVPVIKTVGTAILFALSTKAIVSFSAYIGDAILALKQMRTATNGVAAANATVAKSNPYIFIATCIGLVIGAISSAISYTSKFTDAMTEVEMSSTASLMENIYLYKELANTIRSATTSEEEREKAIKKMQNALQDILPDEYLELKYINAKADGYQNAENAMRAYYEALEMEQKKAKARELLSEEVTTDTGELVGAISKNLFVQRHFGKVTHEMQKEIEAVLPFIVGQMIKELESGELKATKGDIDKYIRDAIKETTGYNVNFFKEPIASSGSFKDFAKRGLIFAPFAFLRKAGSEQLGALNSLNYYSQISDLAKDYEKFNEQLDIIEGASGANAYLKQKEIFKQMEDYYSSLVNIYQDYLKGAITTEELGNNITRFFSGIEYNKQLEPHFQTFYNTFKQLGNAAKNGYINFQQELGVISAAFLQEIEKNIQIVAAKESSYFGRLFVNLSEVYKGKSEEVIGGDVKNAILDIYKGVKKDLQLTPEEEILFSGFLPTDKSSIGDIRSSIEGKVKMLQDDLKAYKNALKAGLSETEAIELHLLGKTEQEIKREIEILDLAARRLGGDGSKDKDKNEKLKKQIDLIRKMADAYEEMWEKYGKAYADAHIYSEARTAAFDEAELNIKDFSVGGRIDEKNNLAKLVAKTSADMLAKESAIAEVEVEIQAKDSEQTKEEMSRLFESMFGNYEVSLEMDELHLPKDFAERMYGFKTTSLDDIRKETLKRYGLENLSKLSNKDIMRDAAYLALDNPAKDQIAKNLQFIEKETQKRQKKLADEYVKYARKTQEERIRLKLEEARKLKDIDELVGATNVEKELYKSNVRRETTQKMAKAEWNEFTKTPYIVQMFDNLDNIGTQALDGLSEKLKTLKDDLYSAGLPASELKEILDKINKVEDELNERNPFRGLGEGFKNVFGGLAQARKEYSDQLKKQESADLSYNTLLEAYNNFIDTYGEFGGDAKARKQIEAQMLESKKYAEQMQKETDKVSQKYDDATKSVSLFKQRISDAVEQTKQLAQSAIDIADSYGAFSEKGSKEVADSAMGIVSGATGILQAGVKFATFDWVGGVTSLITGITQLIIGINKTGDAMKQMKIEKELRLVQTLEKEYEKLAKAIETAYSIDYIKQYNQEMMDSLDQQIEARRRMIALEESKKKSDSDAINGWKDEIDDLLEKRDEAEKEYLQKIGGIGGEENYKDVAQTFVDAWLDAFIETGDGLSALGDEFDEFFKNYISKQMLLKTAGDLLSNFFKEYEDKILMVESGDMTAEEFAEWYKKQSQYYQQKLDERLKLQAEAYGAENIANSELSGLSAGIQGISETQADTLAAYLNSIRFFVADSNMQLQTLVALQSGDTDTMSKSSAMRGISWNNDAEETNPMLSQLLVIAEQTRAIRDLFDSVVVGGHKMGRSGIKVFID